MTTDSDQEPKRLHVLLVVILQAHMNPMLRFARCLASKRVHVTLAVTETVRNHLLHRTNLFTTATENSMIDFEFFSDGLTAEFDRDKSAATFATLQAVSAKNLSLLINTFSTKKTKLSCIVFNPFAPWVADVATEHGIPCALLWNQACSIFSINYRYHKNLLNPFEFMECPGIPNLQVSDLPSTVLPSTPVHFRKLISDSARSAEKANWVLGNSFYELEREIIDSMDALVPIRPIGPLVSPFLLGKSEADDETSDSAVHVDVLEAEDSCVEWLDKQRPCSVIYVSFGRVTVLSQKQIDNISTALKNSGRPFLWALKPPAEGSTRDSGQLSRDFLEETREKGRVVTWCSQEKVLMHKAIACFMTHGGWNSSLETVISGVPVIVYPEWTDQPTNAKLLSDVFKVGVRVRINGDEEYGVVSTEEVERCIEEVLEGPRAAEMKKRAMELKEAATKALEVGGSSDQNINKFIKDISARSL
ncbi:UDP-glycosyltransferase 84B2-like [Argentina anserina]|uniref:UDP-glycosyltransferase 84B2-like n=1 Tax=Argentina anserina TaxID=57926 RepID=UPI0021767EF3|nr:UDP-glycosyltransferase 84B2-like [Potentilla anserina]